MLAKKLSLLLLGLVALPSVAAARPAVRHDDSRTAASDRAAVGTESGRERGAELVKKGPMTGLCVRMHCTADQAAAIRSIILETRERLAAERRDDRMLFARMKELRADGLSNDEVTLLKAAIVAEKRQYERLLEGGILGISNVLDDGQRELFLRMVDRVGAKVVFGHGGRPAKGDVERGRAARAETKDERPAKSESKRERAAKGHAMRDRTAKADVKRERKLDKPGKRDKPSKLDKLEAKLERHSAKA